MITYGLPDPDIVRGIIEAHLATFKLDADWSRVLDTAVVGLSQAEVARAADEAAKTAVLGETDRIGTPALLAERRAAAL